MNEVKTKNYEFHMDFQTNKKINPKIFEEIIMRGLLEYTKETNTTMFIKEWGIQERGGEKPHLEPTNLLDAVAALITVERNDDQLPDCVTFTSELDIAIPNKYKGEKQ